jgi:integrase
MNRQSFQKGHVSGPIRTRQGSAFKIRWRERQADGRWKQRSELLYGTAGKKEARSVLEDRIKLNATQSTQPSELTVRAFIDEYWKPYLDRKNVKASTRAAYQSMLDRFVIPALGERRLVEVVPIHVEQFLRDERLKSRSPKTIRNVVILVQEIFTLAVDNDLIPKSPVRRQHKPALPHHEKVVWTADQLRQIIAAAPEQHRPMFVCVALTGVRLGELLALKWKHVDFENRVLHIQQSLWGGEVQTPKTLASVRSKPMGDLLASALTDRLRVSQRIGPEDFVFCKSDGRPLHPDVVRKDVLYPVLDRLGIARTARGSGFHAFRHAAASLINDRTGDIKLAQKVLGHTNPTMTANVYTPHMPTRNAGRVSSWSVRFLEFLKVLFPNLFPTGNKNRTLALVHENLVCNPNRKGGLFSRLDCGGRI